MKFKKFFSLTLACALIPSFSHADIVDKCMEQQEIYNHAQILFCVTELATRQEEVRNIIEKEYLELISSKVFKLPQLQEYIPPKNNLADEIEEAIKAKKISSEDRRSIANYERKKRVSSQDFKESQANFRSYRIMECTRQKNLYDALEQESWGTIQQQVCLYNITRQRVKTLEDSIKPAPEIEPPAEKITNEIGYAPPPARAQPITPRRSDTLNEGPPVTPQKNGKSQYYSR